MSVSSSANSFCDSSIDILAAPRLVGGRIEPQVADLELGRALDRPTAHQRPQPGEQLGERERLHQVVVGAFVEAPHPVLDRIARGQHQHGRPHPVRAQPPARLEAVHARQHHVEDHRVVVGRAGDPDRVLSALCDVGRHPFLTQAASHQAGHLDIVLDDQNPHG